jgi:Tfp pilus assembly protein PilO
MIAQFFSRLSTGERRWLLVAVVAVSLAAIDRVVVRSVSDEFSFLQVEIDKAETQYRHHYENVRLEEQVRDKYRRYSPYIKQTGSAEEESATTLAEIEGLARQSGVRLQDVKPREAKKTGAYLNYTIDVEAEGGMKKLTAFLYGLNSSRLLLRAETLRLESREQEENLSASMRITRLLIP